MGATPTAGWGTAGTVADMEAQRAISQWLVKHRMTVLDAIDAGVTITPIPPSTIDEVIEEPPVAVQAVDGAIVTLALAAKDTQSLREAAKLAWNADQTRRLLASGDKTVATNLFHNTRLPWAVRRDLLDATRPWQRQIALADHPEDTAAWAVVVRQFAAAGSVHTAEHVHELLEKHPAPAHVIHEFARMLWHGDSAVDSKTASFGETIVVTSPWLSAVTVELMPMPVVVKACVRSIGVSTSSVATRYFDKAFADVLAARLGADAQAWQGFAAFAGEWHGSLGDLLGLPELLHMADQPAGDPAVGTDDGAARDRAG